MTGIPKAYQVKLVAPEEWLEKKVTLTARDISILDTVAQIADAVGADVKISANCIALVPKAPQEPAADPHAGKPADKKKSE